MLCQSKDGINEGDEIYMTYYLGANAVFSLENYITVVTDDVIYV